MKVIKPNSSRDYTPFLLVVFALMIYLPGIHWGIPYATGADRTHAWGNDDQLPLAPLAEMHNTFIVSKPDRNIAYPWFHYFLLACAEGPYLVYQYATGGLTAPTPTYPFGFSDPVSVFRHLSWIGRSVTLLLALATVLGAYYMGTFLWNRKVGFLASVFALLLFPMAYYARTGNLDVPVLGWTALGLAVFTLMVRRGMTIKRGVWLGTFVALAIATKDQAFASFLFLPPVLLWLHFRKGEAHRLWGWTSTWAAPCAALAGFIVIYVLASGIPVDPGRFAQHTAKLISAGTQTIYIRYPATLSGYAAQTHDALLYLIDVMSWPLLIAAGVGIIMTLRRDRLAAVLVLSSLGCLVMLLPVRFTRIHYLLPVALPLTVFAAYAFYRGLESTRTVRVMTALAAVVTVGYMLLQTIDLTHAMIYDARYEAGGWLDEQAQYGDSVLYFGASMKNPPLRADLQSIHVNSSDQTMPSIQQSNPHFILIIPEDTNEDRHRVEWRDGPHSIYSDYITTEDYQKLVDGSLGYHLVARFQTPRLFPWLYRPFLSYPTVNPPVHIYAREDRAQDHPQIEPWETAPHYPRFIRVRELTVDQVRARAQ